MRHKIFFPKLQRDGAHRIALMKNLTKSIFKYKAIETTKPKADSMLIYAGRFISRLLKKENDRDAIAYIKERVAGTDKNCSIEILNFYRLNKDVKKSNFLSKKKVDVKQDNRIIMRIQLIK